MAEVDNPELAGVLHQTLFHFHWDDITRTWQIERKVNGNTWRSVMYLAPDRSVAQRQAAQHIRQFYLQQPGHTW